MEFYALLIEATLIIALLGLALYRRSRDAGTLVGTAALYYWSLFGAWYLVIDKTGGFSGKHYQYLERKLFPIHLDSDYLTALMLYALFIVAMQLTLLAVLPRTGAPALPRLVLRHEPILAIGFASFAGSVALMGPTLGAAWDVGASGYLYTRGNPGQWFTLHQVLNRAALLPPAVGLATLLAGERSRYFASVRGRYTLPAYLALLAGMGLFTFLLGNKNEVLTALAAGTLAYLGQVPRPRWVRLGLTLAAGAWFLYAIEFFRATPLAELPSAISSDVKQVTEVGRFLTSSNEAYGAHFSMYGVLSRRVEPRFGYSLFALACSIAPRALWPTRPPDIYLYYSESVGAVQNQGYSLHQATGWYLNFGPLGVALGGAVLGLVWAYCLRARARIGPRAGLPFRLFAVVSPWLFPAYLPALVRAGPEGYKGFLIEGVIIPVGLLLFCARPRRAPRPRLMWNPQTGWGFSRG
jgi:hypothetical protein